MLRIVSMQQHTFTVAGRSKVILSVLIQLTLGFRPITKRLLSGGTFSFFFFLLWLIPCLADTDSGISLLTYVYSIFLTYV